MDAGLGYKVYGDNSDYMSNGVEGAHARVESKVDHRLGRQVVNETEGKDSEQVRPNKRSPKPFHPPLFSWALCDGSKAVTTQGREGKIGSSFTCGTRRLL